jgi:hypothetical protein
MLGCKEKKIDLSGETPVNPGDFMAVFPKINLPFTASDTNIVKLADTVTIGYKAFIQFFPDSSLTGIVGQSRKLTIHPVGKIEKEKENYLLLTFTAKQKACHLAVIVTDKKNKFLAIKELLNSAGMDDYAHTVLINREPTFIISREKMGKDNQLQFSRAGWVYTSAGYFMVVVNDSNEDSRKDNIINPLDSLSRKNKYSGDYAQDKKNFISLRDGKTTGSYLFFIHFEKNEGSCIGELKGEMKMKSANTAQFTLNGDPCVIDFSFEDREITLKEQGSCGNHRGIKCFFDDSFTKKKETKSTKKKL